MNFNINHEVRVKLTEAGKRFLKNQWSDAAYDADLNCFKPRDPPEEDAEGWSTWQLWELMGAFGEELQEGRKELPFETEIDILLPSADASGVHRISVAKAEAFSFIERIEEKAIETIGFIGKWTWINSCVRVAFIQIRKAFRHYHSVAIESLALHEVTVADYEALKKRHLYTLDENDRARKAVEEVRAELTLVSAKIEEARELIKQKNALGEQQATEIKSLKTKLDDRDKRIESLLATESSGDELVKSYKAEIDRLELRLSETTASEEHQRRHIRVTAAEDLEAIRHLVDILKQERDQALQDYDNKIKFIAARIEGRAKELGIVSEDEE